MSTQDEHTFFADCVLESFEYLTTEFGFRVAKVAPTYVRYESNTVYVHVYHESRLAELDVSIGLLRRSISGGEQSYHLQTIVAASQGRMDPRFGCLQASDPAVVRRLIPQLAEALRCGTRRALSGDKSEFQHLEAAESALSQALTERMEHSDLRRKAEAAWKNRDYHTVWSAYAEMQQHLTRAELGKMQYARKKIDGSN